MRWGVANKLAEKVVPKFRAWHREYKTWCEPKAFSIQDLMTIGFCLSVRDDDGDCACAKYEDIELMQWTGLQDSVGNDIYDGDIISYQNSTLAALGLGAHVLRQTCRLHTTRFGVKHGDLKNIEPLRNCIKYGENLRVIGNIYSNPELLEETK